MAYSRYRYLERSTQNVMAAMDSIAQQKKNWGTLDVKPSDGQMIKPSETIDIVGIEGLSLQDKRVWNALIANAFGPKMRESDREFTINLNEVRANHNSNERVEDSIEKLMTTIARCAQPNGSVTRFQLLGGNNMGDPRRPRGEMTYNFDKRLIDVLRDSVTFGKLELSVMAAFSSKYALAFYEHFSRRVNLKNVWMQEYTVEEFREVLGVGKGQLKAFGNFKQRAIAPALKEVNYWAPFRLTIAYKKQGQRVTKVIVSWVWKDREGRAKARTELERVKVGRKARMSGVEESIIVLQTDKLLGENSGDLFEKADHT